MSTNFPTTLDNDASLLEAVNNLAGTLDGLLNADANGNNGSATKIRVDTTANFPSAGYIIICDADDANSNIEVISYTSKDATHFIGITRGADGTITLAHATGSVVKCGNNAAYHNNLKDAVVAIETKLGIGAGILNVAGGQFVAGDFYLVGASAFTDITGATFTFTPSAGVTKALVVLDGQAYSSLATGITSIDVCKSDNTSWANMGTNGVWRILRSGANAESIHACFIVTGLTPLTAYTFKLRLYSDSGDVTIYMSAGLALNFSVMEIR